MKRILALILALLIPALTEAGVTVVDTPTGVSTVSTTATFSHTSTGNGLFVCAVWANPSASITDVTFNGTSFFANQLWSQTNAGVVGAAGFLMLNPPSVTANVIVTWNASESVGVAAFGLSGLNTSSLAAAHRTVYLQSGAAQPNLTVADSQSGDLVVDCVANYNTATLTAGAGQTSQYNLQSFGGTTSRSGGTSTEVATGANTVMSWTGASGAEGGGATALVAGTGGAPTFGFYRRRPE